MTDGPVQVPDDLEFRMAFLRALDSHEASMGSVVGAPVLVDVQRRIVADMQARRRVCCGSCERAGCRKRMAAIRVRGLRSLRARGSAAPRALRVSGHL